MIEKLTRN